MKSVITDPILISNTSRQSLPLNVGTVYEYQQVNIRIVKVRTTQRQKMNPSLMVELVAMRRYECESVCVQDYERWLKEAVVASRRSGLRCDIDKDLYAVNFEKCLGESWSLLSIISFPFLTLR